MSTAAVEIHVPAELKVGSAIAFLDELTLSSLFEEKVIIKCGDLNYVEPYAMILVANGIRKVVRDNPQIKFQMRGPYLPYASYMGFFHFCGQRKFEAPRKPGNPRHSPITKLNVSEFQQRAADHRSHVIDEVQEKAELLASVLARSKNEELYESLAFAILEILRNVFEHSESDALYYCAQYWPSKDKVEIGILDCGMGLRMSLNQNPDLDIASDVDAIYSAMTPGVTKSKYTGRPKSKWANAGYGLYMTSRICEEGGSFLIMSGEQGLYKNRTKKQLFKCELSGTGVRLILRPSRILNIQRQLRQFKLEADEIIKATGGMPSGDSPSTVLKTFRRRKN